MSARRANRIARFASLPISAVTARRPRPARCQPSRSGRAPRLSPRRRSQKPRLVGRWGGGHGGGFELVVRLRLDIARDLAAAFDLDLTVADRAGDPAGRADQEPLAHRQIAFEAAAHLGLVDRSRALEQPRLGAIDIAAALQIGFDAALDDQLVARVDLARERDFAADD